MDFSLCDRIMENISRVIVGKNRAIELLLVALLAEGHVLLEDVPGVAKTLLAKSLAKCIGGSFNRVQFTPDLLPSDITGFNIYDQKSGRFAFHAGPVITHVLVADEINRTIPRTQSSLLECMEERQVTVDGQTHPLPAPFFVMATQNPIELEGTYPLPEAQLDRFMFEVVLDYLPEEDEVEVVRATTTVAPAEIVPVVSKAEILAFQQVVRRVPVADAVVRYAVALTRSSRPMDGAPDYINQWLSYGASVRAAQALVLGGKARALLQGRSHVTYDDVRALARPVFRHRLLRNFQAQSERVTTDSLVDRLIETVPRPKSGL